MDEDLRAAVATIRRAGPDEARKAAQELMAWAKAQDGHGLRFELPPPGAWAIDGDLHFHEGQALAFHVVSLGDEGRMAVVIDEDARTMVVTDPAPG